MKVKNVFCDDNFPFFLLERYPKKFYAYIDFEPNAVSGKTYEEFLDESLQDCIMDKNDRQCNFRDGDIVDHVIVSSLILSRQA